MEEEKRKGGNSKENGNREYRNGKENNRKDDGC